MIEAKFTILLTFYFFYHIYLFFRQVEPTVDNTVANSLSSEVQARNVKLVKVNTRVTLVVWVLESIANICIAIFWVAIYGTTDFGTLTNSMIWYYLLISYTFLMNTSYNKGRIVDDGWKPVLLNSIVNPFKVTISKEPDQSTSSKIKDTLDNLCLCRKKSGKFDRLSPKSLNDRTPSVARIKDQSKDSQVFTISKHELDVKLEDFELSKNVPMPSQSPGRENPEIQEKARKILSSNNLATNPDYDNEYRLRMGEEILSRMLKEVNDENSYLHYFKQLIAFENFLKDENKNQSAKFVIIPFYEMYNPERQFKSKYPFGNNKIGSRKDIKETKYTLSKNSKRNLQSVNVNCVVDVLIRAQLRRDMLKHYKVHCKKEQRYNDFLNSIIEFEDMLTEKSLT